MLARSAVRRGRAAPPRGRARPGRLGLSEPLEDRGQPAARLRLARAGHETQGERAEIERSCLSSRPNFERTQPRDRRQRVAGSAVTTARSRREPRRDAWRESTEARRIASRGVVRTKSNPCADVTISSTPVMTTGTARSGGRRTRTRATPANGRAGTATAAAGACSRRTPGARRPGRRRARATGARRAGPFAGEPGADSRQEHQSPGRKRQDPQRGKIAAPLEGQRVHVRGSPGWRIRPSFRASRANHEPGAAATSPSARRAQ